MGFVDGLIKVIGFFMEEGANSYERTAREARSQARRTGNQANYERANEAFSIMSGNAKTVDTFSKGNQQSQQFLHPFSRETARQIPMGKNSLRTL